MKELISKDIPEGIKVGNTEIKLLRVNYDELKKSLQIDFGDNISTEIWNIIDSLIISNITKE